MYGRSRNGGMYMKPEWVRYKRQIALMTSSQMQANTELGYKLELYAGWYTKGKDSHIKKRDSNNMLKLILDAVCEALQIDDSQFFEESIVKKHSNVEQFIITVYELGPDKVTRPTGNI